VMWSTCAHVRTTEPDEQGQAICLSCSRVIVTRLTEHTFREAVEAIRRNGHSRRCVSLPGGCWVCDEGCSHGHAR
jgi:hypothetical protein